MTPLYLVLLHAGFSLPSALRRTRCALTAPFHPYLGLARLTPGALRAVCFLCHFPSGHPDRGLPGALPFGVRTFLPARCHIVTPHAAVVCPSTADCQRSGFLETRPPGQRCFVGHNPPGCSLLAPCQTDASPENHSPSRCSGSRLGFRRAPPPTRRSPVESDTAPASCTGCYEAYRSPRRSSRCSSRVPGAFPRGTPARRPP